MKKVLHHQLAKPNWFHYLLTSFLFLIFAVANSQNTTPVFSWDAQVNCSNWQDNPKRELGIEEIDNAACLQTCEESQVTYTLSNVPVNSTVNWTVQGGGNKFSINNLRSIN